MTPMRERPAPESREPKGSPSSQEKHSRDHHQQPRRRSERNREAQPQEQEDKEPLLAKAESGQALIDEIVKNTAEFVAGMIDGSQVAEIPEFHS